MKHYACPHCGEDGISLLRKLTLGPAIRAKCKKCGKLVTVKYWHVLLVSVPVAIPILIASESGFSLLFFLSLGACLMATSILTAVYIPLLKHEHP